MGKRIELTQVYRKPRATVIDAGPLGGRVWPKPKDKRLALFDAVTNIACADLMETGTASAGLKDLASRPSARAKPKPRKAKKAQKPKPTKAQTSPSRKIYLTAKAKERRAAVKAGLSLKDYRIQQGKPN